MTLTFVLHVRPARRYLSVQPNIFSAAAVFHLFLSDLHESSSALLTLRANNSAVLGNSSRLSACNSKGFNPLGGVREL